MRATLVLGSNLGDRNGSLDMAVEKLSAAIGSGPLAVSPTLETTAEGFEGPAFLNRAVSFECSLSPEDLLSVCKRTEREMGRTDTPEYDAAGKRIYHDRTIDIDILYYGGISISTPGLTIPHPQVRTRSYVAELLRNLK